MYMELEMKGLAPLHFIIELLPKMGNVSKFKFNSIMHSLLLYCKVSEYSIKRTCMKLTLPIQNRYYISCMLSVSESSANKAFTNICVAYKLVNLYEVYF